MNYLKIDKCDIANGLGVGVVLWVAGCKLRCPGCHNPQTWPFDAGKPFTDSSKLDLMDACSKPYITRLTLSGGHPLESENLDTVYEVVSEFKKRFPDKKIWMYTGYIWTPKYNEAEQTKIDKIIHMCDILVDGPFVASLRDITLKFRGSSNQRVIDVKKTLDSKNIVCML